MHIMPRGAVINAIYTIKVLVMMLFHVHGPLQEEEACHGPAAVMVPLGQRASPYSCQREGVDGSEVDPVLEHSPYLPDLTLADDFFLFQRAKEALVGISLDQDSLKDAWEGVIRIITVEDFTKAFRRCFKWAEKCVQIGRKFIEKS